MGLARRAESRAISYQDYWGKDYESSVNVDQTGMMWYGPRTFAGINVTQERALRATAVWACVSIIADSISMLPIDAHRLGSGWTTEIKGPSWLQKPSNELTRFDFWHRVVTSMLLDGNSYTHLGRESTTGSLTNLTPIHPYRVQPQRNPSTNNLEFLVDHTEIYTPNEILHIPAFTKPGDLKGMSPIEAAKESIGLSLVAEEFGARFFGQGATMSGIISTPNDLKPDAATIIQKTFAEKHSGPRKAHLPGVLTGGATWTPLSVPPNDAQFLETRAFQIQEIARMYRVPLHLIQELDKSTSWGTGIEEQNAAFATYTLGPWLVRIEDALSGLMPGPQVAKFNLDNLLRGKKLDRFQAYAIGLTNGIYNKDEVREMEDLPPIPDGSGTVHLQPLNMGVSGVPAEKPKPDPTPVTIIDPASSNTGNVNDPVANGAN